MFTLNLILPSQYFSDCNEVSVSLDDLEAATSIDDLGHDEDTVEELLKKHKVRSFL